MTLGANQIWERRNPVGGEDLWDVIRIVGVFESEFVITSNLGFTESISAIAESIVEFYKPVGAQVPEAPWETPAADYSPERALASRG